MPVMLVPDYDFICYFLAQAFPLPDIQPVMPVPQWCFRLNRLRLNWQRTKKSSPAPVA
jgi:hypothetical protein